MCILMAFQRLSIAMFELLHISIVFVDRRKALMLHSLFTFYSIT